MTEKLLKPEEVALLLGVKLSTVYHWSHINYIPTVKLGNLLRFRESSIMSWIEKKESKGRVKRKIDIRKLG